MSDTGRVVAAPSSRLLIVDDDPLIRLLARERLERHGLAIDEAPGGAEAVEAFAQLLPDLVLLDVEMPGLDGFDVCKAIRKHASGLHVPILMLTGRNDVPSIERAYEAGATDFVTKPINWLILAHRVRYMLRASESFLAVRSQQVRLDEVQQHAHLGSWELDLRTGLLTTSRTLRSMIGLLDGPESLPVQEALEVVHPEDRPDLERVALAGIANREGFALEHRIVARGGAERIVHSQSKVRMSARDECLALEGFSQDITERRRIEEQVRLLAFSDSLTGLANRAAFKLHVDKAIPRTERAGRMLAILYLDLDNFKRVNDTFGHTAGDQLLRIVADLLEGCVRETDVVARTSSRAPNALISRLGGDEFTILLEDLRDSSDPSVVAERVLEALARPVLIDGHEIRTAASIGIAVWPQDGTDLESLLKNADAAMYHAKELGRGNYQYYRRSLNSEALERLELEADLSGAIEADRLMVGFQPTLELASGRICGCEALVRWSDARRGVVPPESFVPLAESSRMMLVLGEAILRQACTHARVWQEGGHPGLDLAVNLSLTQIKDERLVATIEKVLGETGFDPRLLEFEITGSAIIQDAGRTVGVLEELRRLGCKLSLDDFGTRHSSLGNLKEFPVQSLKIDRSFVAGIGSSREDEAIIRAILSLAHSVGMRVVAKGIETDEQLEFLREHRCDAVQGFLVSKPLAPEDFGAFLDAQDG